MDFSYPAYKNLIKISKKNSYKFDVFKNLKKGKGKNIYLRHDIDVDLAYALEMAKIETELDIRSTYFIMLRSPVYNVFSRENAMLLKEIISLNHEIGLHYDEGFYQCNKKSIQTLVAQETKVLEDIFDVSISTISFHQPSARIINNDIKIDKYQNTYDKEDMRDIYYISDSNMHFKEDPIKAIESNKYEKIQILIHPIWWGHTLKKNSTEKIWEISIKEAFLRMQRQLLETERAYGKKRKFQIT